MNNRYIRQLILPGFGMPTQHKLADARVLIVGMGGLGCPALQYLVGAGVGTIGIMDADSISESNLHRQLLYDESAIGRYKVAVAAEKMRKQNSQVHIVEYAEKINNQNAFDIIQSYDVIIDATDNFAAKYLINDVCACLEKPLVFGAVSKYQGQVAVFNVAPAGEIALHYRHLYPIQPSLGEIASCEETGVIGVLPGIIGSMQAAECIKLITGLGKPLYNALLNYDFLTAQWLELALEPNPFLQPMDRTAIEQNNYNMPSQVNSEEVDDIDIEEIDVNQFLQAQNNPDVFILDVRELHEYPSVHFAHAQIPLSELPHSMNQLPSKPIYVICHQGIRSVYAAQLIKLHKQIDTYSLKGGLTAYFNKLSNE